MHAAVWKVNAAGATIVRHLDAQEVFVSEILSMAGRLHSSHQELVFWRDLLLDTFLLVEFLHVVLDLV